MDDAPADSGMHLNQQLCFALYACSRAMTRAYQPMLREFGLTYPQYLVLLLLWQWDQEGKPAHAWTVGALGEQLMLDSGTLTPLLKRMEKLELVGRRRSDVDERVTLVGLSERGRALQPIVKAWRDRALGQLAVSPQRLSTLHRELWLLLDELREND